MAVVNPIELSCRDLARSILVWLSFCLEPLTLNEVASAMGLLAPDSVLQICTTYLISIDSHGDLVRLAHFSVKEFHVTAAEAGNWFQLSVLSGHEVISLSNITAILRQTRGSPLDTVRKIPFFQYGAKNRDKHFNTVEDIHPHLTLRERAINLFRNPDVFHDWQVLQSGSDDFYWQLIPIGLASMKGLIPIVAILLEGADPLEHFMCEGYYPTNEFTAAAGKSHLGALALLLEGASISLDLVVKIMREFQVQSSEIKELGRILQF